MQKVGRELQAIRQEYKEIIKVQNQCFQLRIAKIARADIRGRIAIKKAWKWDKFQENPETNFESALNQRETVNKRNFYNTDQCKANQREKTRPTLVKKLCSDSFVKLSQWRKA